MEKSYQWQVEASMQFASKVNLLCYTVVTISLQSCHCELMKINVEFIYAVSLHLLYDKNNIKLFEVCIQSDNDRLQCN